ncbi:uncharacterized protein LOC134661025 [Cydia amplana]|uniref:uncharacterized protein LOC134661025 n=1 Tax=Cydia amplana TaxID=1869771 RepID=UPI002FE51805
MATKELLGKLADIPLAKPGFEALDMTAPVLVSLNPDGNWQKSKPDCLDEEQLKTVVAHLVKSKAVSAAQSYCSQCAAEKTDGGASNYVPVIMMPLYPADQCPFDMNCEIQKMKESEPKKKTKAKAVAQAEKDDKDAKKKKKRGFVMQRLNDFDLLSQW